MKLCIAPFPKWGSHELSRTSARNRFGHHRHVQGGLRRQTAAGRVVRADPSRRNRTKGGGKGRCSASRENNRGQRQGVVRNDHRLADRETLNAVESDAWIPRASLLPMPDRLLLLRPAAQQHRWCPTVRTALPSGSRSSPIGGRHGIAVSDSVGRRPVTANAMKTPLTRATTAPARRRAGRMVSHSRTVRACSGPRSVAEIPCMHMRAPNKRRVFGAREAVALRITTSPIARRTAPAV
jgi:hypothetical protein